MNSTYVLFSISILSVNVWGITKYCGSTAEEKQGSFHREGNT